MLDLRISHGDLCARADRSGVLELIDDGWAWDALFDAVSGLLPYPYFFGATEGDGSDYGVNIPMGCCDDEQEVLAALNITDIYDFEAPSFLDVTL